MATATTPNPRASLLAGLRTGGVRSASQPHHIPHTAAPGGSFNVPRFASASHPSNQFPEEEDENEQIVEMAPHFSGNIHGRHGIPMTAGAADGAVNKFQEQQQQQHMLRQLAAQRAAIGAAIGGGIPYPDGDHTEMQAQMMQMEMLKYQAFQQAQQAQQYQAELIAHAHRQQQQQQQQSARGTLHRPSMEPVTAGPTATAFDHRANAVAQLRARTQQAEHRSALSAADDLGPVPMTAAIGGKFATRLLNPQANSFVVSRFSDQDDDTSLYPAGNTPSVTATPTPGRTTVISGGTSLGTPTTSTFNIPAPSKSDAAVSWRRGTTNHSVLRTASSTQPPSTKVNRTSLSHGETPPSLKARPQPLRFSVTVSAPLPAVSVDTSGVDDDASSGSSKGGSPTSTSSPLTPPSPPSTHSSLSSESKKPYEGLGIGRPAVSSAIRQASLPSRQPKGPPSGAEELGPRNFATRLGRKAIGGLEALEYAREGRAMAIEIQAY